MTEKKVGWIGREPVTVEIEIKQERKGRELSICGNVYYSNGRGPHSCGQNIEDVESVDRFANGWSRELVAELVAIWRRWHLNGMQAGCQHQRALGWKSCRGHYDPDGLETCTDPIKPATREAVAQAAREARRDGAGLVKGPGEHYYCGQDKVNKPCPECGYEYGSAWLHEPLPPEVFEFVRHVNSLS